MQVGCPRDPAWDTHYPGTIWTVYTLIFLWVSSSLKCPLCQFHDSAESNRMPLFVIIETLQWDWNKAWIVSYIAKEKETKDRFPVNGDAKNTNSTQSLILIHELLSYYWFLHHGSRRMRHPLKTTSFAICLFLNDISKHLKWQVPGQVDVVLVFIHPDLCNSEGISLHSRTQVKQVGLVIPLNVSNLGTWNYFNTASTCPYLHEKNTH